MFLGELKMKTKKTYKHFREQITEHDCVPTSFINALIYLFEREEIPAEVVRRIYEYTLDVPKSGGTTGYAIEFLANWLSSYRKDNFALRTEIWSGSDVYFKKENSFLSKKKKKACGLLRVLWGGSCWHYITIFYEKDGWVYCFDPYRGEKSTKNWEWLEPSNENEGCNLKVSRSFFNKKEVNGKFSTGECAGREFVLIERISQKK